MLSLKRLGSSKYSKALNEMFVGCNAVLCCSSNFQPVSKTIVSLIISYDKLKNKFVYVQDVEVCFIVCHTRRFSHASS